MLEALFKVVFALWIIYRLCKVAGRLFSKVGLWFESKRIEREYMAGLIAEARRRQREGA